MASPIYADLEDYREWSGESSATPADVLFRRASEVIDEVLTASYYLVDDDGAPTEAAEIEALKEATCAQVQAFLAAGDTTGSGSSTVWESAKIGSLSLSGRKTGTASGAITVSGVQVAASAVRILRLAGLLGHGVTLYG